MMHASNLNYKSKLKHCLPGIWTESSSLILLREVSGGNWFRECDSNSFACKSLNSGCYLEFGTANKGEVSFTKWH